MALEILLGYLLLGVLFAWSHDGLVVRDFFDPVDRVVCAARCVLAWPTYLVEDFIFWTRSDDEDGD